MNQDTTIGTVDDPGATDADDTSVWKCSDCRERWYYHRALCPNCGCESAETAALGSGRLVATTTAHVTPTDVRAENPLGLATFASDVNVLAQLPSEESRRPAVGDAVCLVGVEQLRDTVEGPRLHLADETQVAEPLQSATGRSEVSE